MKVPWQAPKQETVAQVRLPYGDFVQAIIISIRQGVKYW
jgi:hypothetical protein